LTRRPVTALPLPPGALQALGLGSSLLVGMLLAREPQLGIALLVATIYTPLVLLNLRLGIAIYAVLLFLLNLPVVWVGPTAASILILAGWGGSLRASADWARQVVRDNRRMVTCMVLLVALMAVSALWATNVGDVGAAVWVWASAALAALIIMTTFSDRRSIELLVTAFVFGAVVSVLVGIFAGSLTGAPEGHTATSSAGRFGGGSGDPNYFAAAQVPAIVMAIGLANLKRGLIERWLLTCSVGIMALGVAASQSRGGLIGALAAMLAAVIFFRGRRVQALAWLSIAVVIATAWFASSPAAWQRITDTRDAGNGRSDLWSVAWQMTTDHPVLGVGLNNYRAVAPDYTRKPGQLVYVQLIAEDPHFVHNAYLQMLSELGFAGLLLMLGVIGASLRAAYKAGRRFEELGDRAMAALSQSVLVGTIGMLVAFFFISNGIDQRLWILLGLGPALWTLSRREHAPAAEPMPPLEHGSTNGHGRTPIALPAAQR
jgi:O-antigen ligase